jgi:polyphosphate kinase
MFRRVEIAFPFEIKRIRERVIKELNYYLEDNTQAWMLQDDGKYTLQPPDAGEAIPAFNAQAALLDELAEN